MWIQSIRVYEKRQKKFCQYFYNKKSHTAPPRLAFPTGAWQNGGRTLSRRGDSMRVEQFVMAHGASIGKTLPAYPEEVQTVYPRQDCTAQNAAIPCRQVLGAYMVAFDRS